MKTKSSENSENPINITGMDDEIMAAADEFIMATMVIAQAEAEVLRSYEETGSLTGTINLNEKDFLDLLNSDYPSELINSVNRKNIMEYLKTYKNNDKCRDSLSKKQLKAYNKLINLYSLNKKKLFLF